MKILFWIPDIDKLFEKEKPQVAIGGANVQMGFWAKYFSEKGFFTYTFTDLISRNKKIIFGVKFIYFPLIRKMMWFLNFFKIIVIFIIRPDWIIVRVNTQELGLLLFFKKILNFKVLYMLANDENVNFKNPKYKQLQNRLFQTDAVIAQNLYQRDNYNLNYNKFRTPIIPNIWDESFNSNRKDTYMYDFIWVANIRSRKRPLWFIEIAKRLPNFSFAMIGASLDDKLNQKCMSISKEISNLNILGYLDFHETTDYIAQSKFLICTAEYEGFPNTFLQAWAHKTPIISTVNPNDCFTKYQIGYYSTDLNELINFCKLIIHDEDKTEKLKKGIDHYFLKYHKPSSQFLKFKKIITP